MADYRKLAIALMASDGKIDSAETRLLKKALYADGRISRDEVAFVAELRAAVVKKAKALPTTNIDKFFLVCLHDNVLGNGIISVDEVHLIKTYVVGDKKLVGHAKKFMDGLKAKATQIPAEFDALYANLPGKKK